MFAITAKSKWPGVQVGDSFGGGTVYKIWNGGQNGMVVMDDNWNPQGIIQDWIAFQYGGVQSGFNFSNADNGLGNTYGLYQAGVALEEPWYKGAGWLVWTYTRIDPTYWAENDGYGDWFIPAENQLQEVYNSGVMVSPSTGDGGYYMSSTYCCAPSGYQATKVLSFNDNTWSYTINDTQYSGQYTRLRLVREF